VAEAPIVKYEPDEIVVGESAKWRVDLPYYRPADGWTVEYGFVSASQKSVTVTGTDNGDGTHLITLDTTFTSALTPDLLFYQAFASNSGTSERVKVREGRLTVKADYSAQAASFDARSNVKLILDQINDLLAGRTVRDVDSYTINGRSLVKMKAPELIKLKQFYEAEYDRELRAEKVKRGDKVGGTVRTRFNSSVWPHGWGRYGGR